MPTREPKQPSKVATLIGPGTQLVGEIRARGSLHIEGEVSGRIESEAAIVVQNGARVKADLDAVRVVVSGQVEGNITAREYVECTPSARITGNISAPRITMMNGAVVEGRCTMMRDIKRAALPVSTSGPAPRVELATPRPNA